MRNLESVMSADKREWDMKKKVVLQRPFMRVRHFNFTQQTVTAIYLNSGKYFSS
jgi:poly-beta-hydroxyalkanoate depolymerase